MKNIVLIGFMLSIWLKLGAQSACAPYNISTNPSNPYNIERPEMANSTVAPATHAFDWTATSFNANFLSNSLCSQSTVESPFYSSNPNVEILNLMSSKDNKPEDGWELLRYNFGYGYPGVPNNNPPTNTPYIILYNRLKGMMRVFVLPSDLTTDYQLYKISLEFDRTNGKKTSSAINNGSTLRAVEDFDGGGPIMDAISVFDNNTCYWRYADFFVAYDPCTCLYNSTLVVTARLLSEANISLEGTLNGEIAQNNHKGDGAGKATFGLADFVAGAKKVYGTYETADGFKSDLFDDIEAYEKANTRQPMTSDVRPGETADETIALSQVAGSAAGLEAVTNIFTELASDSKFLREGLKAMPYIGAAVSFLDVFIGGGEKEKDPNYIKFAPMSIRASAKFEGSIKAEAPYNVGVFYNPSSSQQIVNSVYPLYNNTLGVMNVLKTPQAAIKNIINISNTTITVPDPNGGLYNSTMQQVVPFDNKTYQFYLNDSIQYVVNPSAGFKSGRPEILAALIIEFDEPILKTAILSSDWLTPGSLPVTQTVTNDWEIVSSSYLQQENLKEFRTQYLPIGCLQELLPSIQIRRRQGVSGTINAKVYVKLIANLERSDATANSQNILFVGKFPANILAFNQTKANGIVNAYASNAKEFIVLENGIDNSLSSNLNVGAIVPNNQSAYSAISIIDPIVVSSSSANVVYQAGNCINLLPGAEISSDATYPSAFTGGVQSLTLQIQQPYSCQKTALWPSSEVSSFCTSSTYTGAHSRPAIEEPITETVEADKTIYGLTPNPTEGNLNLSLDVQEEQVMTIVLSDLNGRTIQVVEQDKIFTIGEHTVTMDLSSLSSSIYILTCYGRNTVTTFRVIKQ